MQKQLACLVACGDSKGIKTVLLIGGDILVEMLKHFAIFYFMLNLIITFIAIKYDSPKDAIKYHGMFVLVKVVVKLLIGGIVFAILQIIDDM